MPRYDISRLRKEHGMSQSELANHLQMAQSFLSAIENGKSPLPVEKEDLLLEVFNLQSLNDYRLDKRDEYSERKLTELTDSDLFNQLLNRFHKQAHSEHGEHHHHDHHERIAELQQKVDTLFARNEALMERNDRLSLENDRLRADIDNYRREIDNLREKLFSLQTKK